MKSLSSFLRAHTRVVFLAHQAFIFAAASGFLYSVGRLTGRAVALMLAAVFCRVRST